MTDLKAKRICDEFGRGIPYVMIISYILDKGQATISQVTDEEIEKLEENDLMTKDFVQTLVRTAREVVLNCDQSDIIRLAKAEWRCEGEQYDPDLEQFVNAIEPEYSLYHYKDVVEEGKMFSYNIGFDNYMDETRFDVNNFDDLVDLWFDFCEENDIDPDTVNYVEKIEYEEE